MINEWIKNLALSLIAILLPLKAIAAAIVVLVIADLITGCLAARKLGEKIESNKLKRSVSKLMLYYSATLVSYVATVWLVDSLIPVQKMVTTLIGIVEVKSILENLDIIHGGNFFKAMLQRLEKKSEE